MGLGLPEILVILVLVLILFGAGKLPKVMGDLGKGMQAFKDGMNEKNSTQATQRRAAGSVDDAPVMPGRATKAKTARVSAKPARDAKQTSDKPRRRTPRG